jgi:RNA 3'-terminal phosphate cyclase (ATP)
MVTGRPISIENIRAGRQKPGLMRQHLTAVRAAEEICSAEVTGGAIGSRSLTFQPGEVRAREYRFSVGTAGSATLVLQTVLPALLMAGGPSQLVLEGGTHNAWAPPFDFLERAFVPLVNRMGPHVAATLQRHGFYPAGGGRFTVSISPVAALAGFDLLNRGHIRSRSVTALVSNLPRHIAEREVDTVLKKMNWGRECKVDVREVAAHGPGNAVFIELASEHVTEVFTSFGRQGVRAERVATEAVQQARRYLAAEVPVGPYLADQLMLPLGISAWQAASTAAGQRGGSFITLPLTRHSQTHLDILRQMLGIEAAVQTDNGETCRVALAASACV